MAERYTFTSEEVLGSFNEAIRNNFLRLDDEQQSDIIGSKTPDQFMMSFTRHGETLFDGKTVEELESLIDDINHSALSRRVGGNRLLGYLEGRVDVLRRIPDMKIADLAILCGKFLPLSAD